MNSCEWFFGPGKKNDRAVNYSHVKGFHAHVNGCEWLPLLSMYREYKKHMYRNIGFNHSQLCKPFTCHFSEVKMGRYLDALEKRGITVRLSPAGSIVVPKKTSASLRAKILDARDDIVAELTDQARSSSVWMGDPRPDLPEDSALWTRLLHVAADSPLLGPLHGFRCCGARLRRAVTGYHIYCDETSDGFLAGGGGLDWNEEFARWLRPADDLITRSDCELTRLLQRMT